MKIGVIVLSVILLCSLLANGFAQETEKVRAYYFGNSLTGCSDPKDHPALGKSVGKEWETWAFLGAGWQLWQHRHALQTAGAEMKRDDNGDLTIDPESVKHSTGWNKKQFLTEKWDVMVLQPFSMSLTWKADKMWGVDFEKETDIGDIACSNDLISMYLSLNPEGRIFMYQNWPAMESGKVPPEDQFPDWAKKENARIKPAEFPKRDEFDYEKEWAEDKYKPSTDPERVWLKENARSKDYHEKLFAAVKAENPDLWKSGRLRVIPVGDIFLELHKKALAGEFPGIDNISDYYTDIQHIRGGLPRYTVAASFYAAIFKEHPGKLDWSIYNNAERYGVDRSHDALPILEITPERAKIVHDTIWEVIKNHPDAKFKK
ncbi:MAG: hypothetical protein ACOC54_03840 [Candidatus Sumerlaeota bacterium]